MQKLMDVLIVGRQQGHVDDISQLVGRHTGCKISARVGGAEVLETLQSEPDVLILILSEDAQAELQALERRAASLRPPVILIGPSSDAQILRLAMRAGAREFFTLSPAAAELRAAIDRIASDRRREAGGKILAVMNARGGSGGSVLAANLAHVLAMQRTLRVALLDLDMQFGCLPLYFDMQANDGLLQALAGVESLDAHALEAHMLKHSSGLHLLGTAPDHFVVPGEVAEERLAALLDALARSYDRVVIDLPRQVDALTVNVIQRADRIVVVVQQTLSHLREAKRLTGLLRRELELPAERIVIAVNRWQKRAALSWRDMEQALPGYELAAVRNDHERVSQSVNLGVPLLAAAAGAPVNGDLQQLAETVAGVEIVRRKGLLSRLFV